MHISKSPGLIIICRTVATGQGESSQGLQQVGRPRRRGERKLRIEQVPHSAARGEHGAAPQPPAPCRCRCRRPRQICEPAPSSSPPWLPLPYAAKSPAIIHFTTSRTNRPSPNPNQRLDPTSPPIILPIFALPSPTPTRSTRDNSSGRDVSLLRFPGRAYISPFPVDPLLHCTLSTLLAAGCCC